MLPVSRMKLFFGLFCDYVRLNKVRMRTQLVSLGLGMLLLEYAFFKPISQELSTGLNICALRTMSKWVDFGLNKRR